MIQMKTFNLIFLMAFFICYSTILNAQNIKIGYLNYDTLMVQTRSFKYAQLKMKQQYSSYKIRLKNIESEYNTLKSELDELKKTSSANYGKIKSKETEVTNIQIEFVKLQKEGVKELAEEEARFLKPIHEGLYKVIASYAKKNNYTHIIDTKTLNCIYILEDYLKELDKKDISGSILEYGKL